VSSTLTPDRLAEARAAAQRRAVAVNIRRAAAKRDLRDGRTSIADLLDDPDLQSIQIAALLRHLPLWGRTRVLQAMRSLELPELITVGSPHFTPRRRAALIAYVDQHPHRRTATGFGNTAA
jgi:hypothetical protein